MVYIKIFMVQNHRLIVLILDILSFALIIGGALIARFSPNNLLSIIGGLLASIGVGLIALRRYFR